MVENGENEMTEESKKRADLIIEGGIVVTMDEQRRIFNPGYVAVGNGKILGTGAVTECPFFARKRLDASNMMILPGIVNAHNHLDQSVYRSCLDEKHNSRDLLLGLARGLTRQRAFNAASLSLLELAHYGVTTTHESHWTHYHLDSTDGICDAVRQSGMRAVVGRGMSDKEGYMLADFVERAEDVLDDLDRLESKYDSEFITISPAPSTMFRCTPEALLRMRDWALERDKIWHLHLAQTRGERDQALRTVQMGSVQYAEMLGLLGPELLAAHCSGLLEQEVDLLGGYGVRIAHCPLTIMRSGEKVPPIWKLEDLGAVVAIGTDGSMTNNGQNPWEAMKTAVYMQRVLFSDHYLGSAEQALELMTIKAALALGMEQRVGSLEPGKEADIAMFRRNQFHLVPDAMLISNLVYSGLNNMAETVFVGGKPILKNGRSSVFDEEQVVARARETQKEMIKEAGLSSEIGLTRSWPVIAP
jgi:5-methylthioadenosine/S-adenosylhomocysteine deaminase